MESAEHLPETLEALEALVKPLWAKAVPLHKKLKAADPKDKEAIREQMRPYLKKPTALNDKIKEVKQTIPIPAPKADLSTDDQQKGNTASDTDHKTTSPVDTAVINDDGDKPVDSATEHQEMPTVDTSTSFNVAPDVPSNGAIGDWNTSSTPAGEWNTSSTPAGERNTSSTPAGERNTSSFPAGEWNSSTAADAVPAGVDEAADWRPFKPEPAWINSSVTEKKPTMKNPHINAVLRFVADGKVHCFGHLDPHINDNVVKVLPIIRSTWTEPTYYGIRIKFPREKATSEYSTLFKDPKIHTVLIKFNPESYTNVDDHVVIDETEFQEFMQHAPQNIQDKAKEAFAQQNLYRITFTYEQKGIERFFYENQYSSSVPEIKAIFDSMELIPGCNTLSIYMWKYNDLPAHLQFLYRAHYSHIPSLEPYLNKYKTGKDVYVQWGKILIPDNESRFDRWCTFSKYSEYHLVVGNAEAREGLKEVEAIKKLRNLPVKMTVVQASPDNSGYVAWMQFSDLKEYKKVIVSAGKGLVTWEPAPVVKPQSELAQGEKPARDLPHGWSAWLITDGSFQTGGSDLAFWLKRPSAAGNNKYKDKAMPPAAKPGDLLKSQMVFFKIRTEVTTTKQLLNTLNSLRFKKTKGNMAAQIKRSLLCGGDQKIYRTVDLLEGLSDEEIAGFVEGLTPSQEALIVSHCRRILNGILLIQGPAGSGKTSMIKIIVQIAHRRGLKVAIVADSNSAADNVIDKVADRSYIAVRVHAQGLERRSLIRTTQAGVDREKLLPADPEPEEDIQQPTVPADDANAKAIDDADEAAQHADGWKDDENETMFTDFLMKSAESIYRKAKSIMSPDDPRMKMIQSALFTWLLKILDFLPQDDYTTEVKDILRKLTAAIPFVELRDLMHKSKKQALNKAEWQKYGELLKECAVKFVAEAARATVCTIAQLGMEWAKTIKFDWTIIDEATVMSEAQFVQLWDESDLIILVGDQEQLSRPSMSKTTENPFADQLRFSPYVRFIENGWPSFMLKEVMRSTAGLEAVSSELFYRGELKPGFSTTLDDETRAMTRLWQAKTRAYYPFLKEEPDGLAYPILLNVEAESKAETTGGTSRLNLFNISAVIDHVIWVLENGIARTEC